MGLLRLHAQSLHVQTTGGSDWTNCAASPAASAWWGVKPAARRPKQSPLAVIATTERTLAERWCRNAANRRSPILFLFVVIGSSGSQEIKPADHAEV
jgi:hypothetical protein